MQLSFMARFSRRFSSVYSLPILTLLASVLILRSDAEPNTKNVEGMGSMDCAPSLSVYWNEILARLPYVETNVTNNSYSDEGLLTSNVPCFLLIFLPFIFSVFFSFELVDSVLFDFILNKLSLDDFCGCFQCYSGCTLTSNRQIEVSSMTEYLHFFH